MNIPLYLIGRNVSVAEVAGVNVQSNGFLAVSTRFSLKDMRVWDEFRFEGDKGLEAIFPLDASIKNYVPTASDYTVTIGEIERADGYSSLGSIYGQNDIIRTDVAVTGPGGVTGWRLTTISVVDTFTKGFVQGKNAVLMTARPCGVLPFYAPGTTDPPF